MMYPPCEWEHYRLGLWLVDEPLYAWFHLNDVNGIFTWAMYCLIPVTMGLLAVRKALRVGRRSYWVFASCFVFQLFWFWGYILGYGFLRNGFVFGFPHGFSWCTELPFSLGLSVLTGSILMFVYLTVIGIRCLKSVSDYRGR